MPKYDVYLYEDCKVLNNKLNIKDEEALDLAEAELSRANIMILYSSGFSDFSANGIYEIHRILFEDIYDWAGKFRVINIQKKEKILAGKSVWYSDCDSIEKDLKTIFSRMNRPAFRRTLVGAFLWSISPARRSRSATATTEKNVRKEDKFHPNKPIGLPGTPKKRSRKTCSGT